MSAKAEKKVSIQEPPRANKPRPAESEGLNPAAVSTRLSVIAPPKFVSTRCGLESERVAGDWETACFLIFVIVHLVNRDIT